MALGYRCSSEYDQAPDPKNIPLHAIDPGPGGYKGEDACNQVNKDVGWVGVVASRLPQLVEACHIGPADQV